jgi:hypothetical protein
MHSNDVPKVVGYEPDLAALFPDNEFVILKGIVFQVGHTEDDTMTLRLMKDVLYVLEDGSKIPSDEWFEKYIMNIDLEVEGEDSRENEAGTVPNDEGRKGEGDLSADGNAGERQDDARSVLTKAFDFESE